MIKIVTDSATQYSPQEAKELGFYLTPLLINIDGQSYRDYEDISSMALIQMIHQEKVPTTSQPSIGEKMDVYNELTNQGYQVIDLTIADGLSGAYQSALMARDSCDHPEQVYVVNTRTLCIPMRLLLKKALEMANDGKSVDAILHMIEASSNTEHSFLIPLDFQFLLRGGRMSNTSAFLGGMLKLIPIIQKTKDGQRLEKFAISRTYKKASKLMIDFLRSLNIDSDYVLSVGHAMNEELAFKMEKSLKEAFPHNKTIVFPISPSFVTQGGPGCVTIQTIKIIE